MSELSQPQKFGLHSTQTTPVTASKTQLWFPCGVRTDILKVTLLRLLWGVQSLFYIGIRVNIDVLYRRDHPIAARDETIVISISLSTVIES